MHPGCNATPCIQARAERDRQRMLELHEALRALQRQVETQASATGTATGATGAPPNVHAALPPLAGAATGAEVAGSRVHYLYFLSSFLLLKTALSKEGRMANAPAQEVFEEIVANATAQVETVVVVAWSWRAGLGLASVTACRHGRLGQHGSGPGPLCAPRTLRAQRQCQDGAAVSLRQGR